MSGGAGTTAFRSILDKPLNQLTEDDISQLTREDCRKYLKDKGMRRPSWNKSQAIQQVISLKALLEPNHDSGTPALRKIVSSSSPTPHNPPRVTPAFSVASNSGDSAKEASADLQVSVSAEDSGLCQGKEHARSATETEERPVAFADERASPTRNQCAADGPVGQMTIFYCGKVNVFEGVPPEKARTIMHLAASPISFSRENSFTSPAAPRCFPWNVQHAASDKGGLLSPSSTVPPPPMQTEKIGDYGHQCWEKENDTDGQTNRKVSLQRYLEKRKDRLKIKRNTGPNSSSLDIYLNQRSKTNVPNGNSSRSSTSSPTQPAQPKTACLPVDLNENQNMEC